MSAKRFTLDTNLLVYMFDPRDPLKQGVAIQIFTDATTRDCMLALQSVGEFYVAVTRKLLRPADAAREAANFLKVFPIFRTAQNHHETALREAAMGRFSYWDAVLLASADAAGCTTILSEDMADGARLGGITVRNPFGPNGLSAAAAAALAP